MDGQIGRVIWPAAISSSFSFSSKSPQFSVHCLETDWKKLDTGSTFLLLCCYYCVCAGPSVGSLTT